MTPVANMPVANARMYAVSASAAAAWQALLAQVIAASGVDMMIIEHNYPAKLDALWDRRDLGCVFMCGWPFIREGATKTLLAAPIPDAEWAQDQAHYRSDFIVAEGSSIARLEDAFGGRFAFNAANSHSGYNAPRAHLATFAAQAPLFSQVAGPFITHQRVVEAVATGAADIAAIDSLSLLLLRRHAPELVRGVRTVAATAPCPLPALVANALTPEQTARVRSALLGLDATDTGRALLADLCLRRFVAVDPAGYAATQAMESMALTAGYPEIR